MVYCQADYQKYSGTTCVVLKHCPINEVTHCPHFVCQILDKGKPQKDIKDVASATLIRIQEEKSMDAQALEAALNNKSSTKAVIKTPGRLTEGKLIDLYNRFRWPNHSTINVCLLYLLLSILCFNNYRDNKDGQYTVQQAALDFELSEELITTLLSIARSPLLVDDKDNLDLKLAR